MSRFARIIVRNRRGKHSSGTANIATMCLVGGRKGKGYLLASVDFWPWSPKSVQEAYDRLVSAALRRGRKILGEGEL